tara:strand:- start:44 stop:391 length:348 start_codon:yes stop_codon:yes gene_type:complete
MTNKIITKKIEDLDDMIQAIEELHRQLIFGSCYDKVDCAAPEERNPATQYLEMAHAQLNMAEASMKLCVYHHHFNIDKQIAQKLSAGTVPPKYQGMTARQVFAAMHEDGCKDCEG